MRIIITNWINVASVFAATFIYAFIDITSHAGTLIQAFLGALISVCLYGMLFWGFFLGALIALDLLLLIWNQNYLKEKLAIEWFLISSPFIYWAIKYNEWIFGIAIIAFFAAQLQRRKWILTITT